MHNKLTELEKKISQIENRNKKVESEKNWETSFTRKASIAVLTYGTLAGYFYFVLGVDPWVNAVIPTTGFLLSTLSLDIIKKIWIGKKY